MSLLKGLRRLCVPNSPVQHMTQTRAVTSRKPAPKPLATTGVPAGSPDPLLRPTATAVPKPEARSCQTNLQHQTERPTVNVQGFDINRLMQIYDTFLLDCDGVLWGNDQKTKFREIDKSIQKLRDYGKRIIFVTNNSMHTRQTYLEKFKNIGGFEADIGDVFSVNYAAAVYLKSIAKIKGKVYALGSKGMTEELNNVGLANIGYGLDGDVISDRVDDLLEQELDPDVQAVLVGYDIHIGFNKIYKAASYLSRPECFYVATNDVETRVEIAQNRVLPLSGAITDAVNSASSRKPVVVGKPHSHLMACVLAANPTIDLSKTLMVGDSLHTDIRFANNAGIDSMLVFTGATSPDDLRAYYETREHDMPTYTLGSFAQFGDML